MARSDGRKRVAYVVPPSPIFAGVERVVHEVATGLAEAHGDELDIHVIFATRYFEKDLESTNYVLHFLDVGRLRSLGVRLRRLVAALKVDVLIVAQVEPSTLVWLSTLGLRVRVFVAHLHGNPRVEEEDGSIPTRVAFALFRHVLSRRISGVLTVSPSQRRYVMRALSPHAPVYYAKNPLRAATPGERTGPNAVEPREPRRDVSSAFRFITVARLSRQKGLDDLLRAAAVARQDLPSFSLTLIGSGPDEAALRDLSRDLGLGDVVEFIGHDPEPAAALSAADCFVLSSRWEGFPLVLLEALAAGLPIVAMDCEFGPSDIIKEPWSGERVPAGDVHALAEAMVRAAHRSVDVASVARRRGLACEYSRAKAAASHHEALTEIWTARSLRPSGRLVRRQRG